ncbi:MAG: hypothetical protein ACK5KM_01750 [Hyphomicrobiaceae bacterium]
MPPAFQSAFLLKASSQMPSANRPECRKLMEADAIEIWIARWLRVPLKVLIQRYGCDSRRLYEVWWGERFPGSRAKAEAAFKARYPGLADRTSYGYRRIPRERPGDDQLGFFD